ncbi:MAG: hypothetical protein PVJ49_01385 [Acidobacteriota bacterium]|jgi:hypothetical protein
MQTIYEYLGPEHFTLMLADKFAEALRKNGFEQRVEAGGALGPHVYEYASNADKVISLSTDHTRGAPGEMELTLETEELDAEVAKVVAEGVLGLLAEASGRLLESVADAETRAQIVDQLTDILAGLKK